MQRYDDEWLDSIYLRGALERAIKRVAGWDTPDWYKAKPLRRLRGELRMVNARLAGNAPPRHREPI